ncbi:phytanoyl-CoA dioxygenase family protein [Blastopirellula marina]|uniref:Phytanoyl-CoA dioxygenase n=1 Tax=Blastopirellula marina TaxID=124 RepID=A0A2S8F704_9BACT|nr:phytanoyl-CoA dioxygenase family protein [Blastopirellula marina]PQO27724.1 phytanoyl-CoA dioxygenase [Blastopirellula marina]PTL41463.1 phytanoyl-CoA dioxygenase [Blastopirellula marina]
MNSNETLARQGYLMLPSVFSADETQRIGQRLMDDLTAHSGPAVLKSRERIYGSRNLLAASPWLCDLAHSPVLDELLRATLGENVGLVRGLFFDKPPDRSWSLPWHRDRTIAVKDNTLPTTSFKNPTLKAGIAHFEAPDQLLANMLTLRIHLDAMTAENGPLAVIPGSHLLDTAQEKHPIVLSAAAGDVLAMRPLLSHSSSMSQAGTAAHRRIVHLEFAADMALPDGIQWHDFLPLQP